MSGAYSVWGAAASTPGVKIAFDSQNIERHLGRLVAADAKMFTSVRREIGEYMVGDVLDNIRDQKLFDGSTMVQSEAAKGGKVRRRIKSGASAGKLRTVTTKPRLTLQHYALLRDSYTYQLPAHGVEFGSALVYSRIHHFGGTAGRGRKTRILARPVMGVAVRQELQIGYLLADMLKGLQ